MYLCVRLLEISRVVFGATAKPRPVLEMAGHCGRQHAAGFFNFHKNRVAIYFNGLFFDLRKKRDQFWKWQTKADSNMISIFKIFKNRVAIAGPKAILRANGLELIAILYTGCGVLNETDV